MKQHRNHERRRELLDIAASLAPRQGYNPTGLGCVRLLRTETVLSNVPVLYKAGAVFVLQGRKQGVLAGELYVYDEDHYLAVAVPAPFRMESAASPEKPLLAVYVEFDMTLVAEILSALEHQQPIMAEQAKSLISSTISPEIEDVVMRLLKALSSPVETAVLAKSILRELHYRILVGPQGSAMVAALSQRGVAGRITKSLARLSENFCAEISIAALASDAGMSIPSYHAHFKALTGTTPIQYVKALRLHQARVLLARQDSTITQVALAVGYVSPAQFSRDFKRHFRRTAMEEVKWAREHLGEMHSDQ
ncbi:AraC family transcriptional regulator [Allorhizobium sp. BGMRC 0089]|uniref:AraC family transcriptional regulator n=1 Tax=Allorhizobium sonneratiae TaxID=2934936 RepID=UPI0020344152|nr:AraC family transcriptional regulator [Allorhizobium sonneratiae]MCM2292729.1 AraC family transcriptional regulator [Allorhizobium sonneratiae]